MISNTWEIFKDSRYDSDKQVCRQCDKFHCHDNSEEDIGFCSFLNKPFSPHQFEWFLVFEDGKCKGFNFKEEDTND